MNFLLALAKHLFFVFTVCLCRLVERCSCGVVFLVKFLVGQLVVGVVFVSSGELVVRLFRLAAVVKNLVDVDFVHQRLVHRHGIVGAVGNHLVAPAQRTLGVDVHRVEFALHTVFPGVELEAHKIVGVVAEQSFLNFHRLKHVAAHSEQLRARESGVEASLLCGVEPLNAVVDTHCLLQKFWIGVFAELLHEHAHFLGHCGNSLTGGSGRGTGCGHRVGATVRCFAFATTIAAPQ